MKATGELLADAISTVCRDVRGRSAILQTLAEASRPYDKGGIDIALDRDFWYGVEQLMRDNRRDLEALEKRSHAEPREIMCVTGRAQ